MTDDEYDNDRIDERVRKLATDHYNPPQGSVPRDAMWANIAAARRAERAANADATVVPIHARRPLAQWRWAAALAAGLLFGVIIDRMVVGRVGAPSATVAKGIVTPPVTPRVTSPDSVPNAVPDSMSDSVPNSVPNSVPGVTPRREFASASPDRAGRTVQRRERSVGELQAPSDRAPAPTTPSAERGLYQVAAMQTLVQAEALLTTYRRADEGQRDAAAMQQAARWSRDVLSSTRLLLDSPASRDPRLRQLLTDLELVLAQIVQLSGAPLQAGERELIERALRERDLLPRLRSAVPAGATAS